MKKIVYIWCCDKNINSGEGILANKFIHDLKKFNDNLNFKIKTTSRKKYIFYQKFLGNIVERFFIPLEGIFYLWNVYFKIKNKHLCYVNYLPLWNFLIFLFLPPKTILGPITGGSKFLKKPILNYIIRKYFFYIFYKISIKILNFRTKKLLFSTNLLESLFTKKVNYHYNYVLNGIKFNRKKIKKKYDLIFYLRNHKNKNTDLQIKLARQIANKYSVVTIGKKINHKNIKNFGYIPRSKLNFILQRTKYSFISSENLYSLFAIDSLENGTYIFYNKENYSSKTLLKNMIPLDYGNQQLFKTISDKLKKKYVNPKNFNLKNFNKLYGYFKI